ncbi:tetratricopeptide repeat protein [Candidatus Riflebacteria bacterium]
MPKKPIFFVMMCITIIWVFTGCGGTSLTEEQKATTATELNQKGWNQFASGNYIGAIQNFDSVFQQRLLTEDQKKDAYNGIGWSLTRQGKILESIPQFELALGSSDKRTDGEARVGLAAAKIQRHAGKQDFIEAVELITGIDKGNADFIFTPNPDHPIRVTNAKAHALLAIAYAFAQDPPNATSQKFKAASLDANLINTSVDKTVEGLTKLGF